MGKWTKQHNTRPPHTHIVSVRIETLDAVVEVIRHVDLARMGDRKSRRIGKLTNAGAQATSLIEKRDLGGRRSDQLRL